MSAETVRNPKSIVLAAELQCSSPERVRTWLEQRAQGLGTSTARTDEEDIESMLLARKDPFIDLSLAQYAVSTQTVETLFRREGPHAKPLRLAVLMSETIARALSFDHMPAALVRRDDEIPTLVGGLDTEEITALFSNAQIDQNFLRDFFEQKAPWEAMDEPRRLAAISALQKNARMSARYRGPMDGYAEYRHDSVAEAAWGLAAKVPTTREWAAHLAWLYQVTPTHSGAKDTALAVAARWIPTDEQTLQAEQQSLDGGDLGLYAQVRKQLARLALRSAHSTAVRQALATHEDPAIRAAVYAHGSVTLQEVASANERDFWLAFNELVWNDHVWRTKEYRRLLHDMAWDPKRDPKSYMDPQNLYKARLEYYQRACPTWFHDEQEPVDPAQLPVTQESFEERMLVLGQSVNTTLDVSQALHETSSKLLGRLAWLGWGVAAVLAVLLYHIAA